MEDRLNVMVMDDEPIIGKRLKRLIEKEGCVTAIIKAPAR